MTKLVPLLFLVACGGPSYQVVPSVFPAKAPLAKGCAVSVADHAPPGATPIAIVAGPKRPDESALLSAVSDDICRAGGGLVVIDGASVSVFTAVSYEKAPTATATARASTFGIGCEKKAGAKILRWSTACQ